MQRDFTSLTEDENGVLLAPLVQTANLNEYKDAENNLIAKYNQTKTDNTAKKELNDASIALSTELEADVVADKASVEQEIATLKTAVYAKKDIVSTKEAELIVLVEADVVDELAVETKEAEVFAAIDDYKAIRGSENANLMAFMKGINDAFALKSKDVVGEPKRLERENEQLTRENAACDEHILVRQDVITQIDAALLAVV